jgi:hypothetical protein
MACSRLLFSGYGGSLSHVKSLVNPISHRLILGATAGDGGSGLGYGGGVQLGLCQRLRALSPRLAAVYGAA